MSPINVNEAAPINKDDRLRVLILGGWSPGPLEYIERSFAADAKFHAPSLHMPPAGLKWLCMWESVTLVTCGALAVSLFSEQKWPELGMWRFPALAAALLAIPLLVILVVRSAIRRCVETATEIITADSVDIVVGFSWGGGILAWMLAERSWRGPSLLLAPTVVAMASAARLKLPRFRARSKAQSTAPSAEDAELPLVYCFHANDDGFVPRSQWRHMQDCGAVVQTLQDVHIFVERSSEEAIGWAFGNLLETAKAEKR